MHLTQWRVNSIKPKDKGVPIRLPRYPNAAP